MGTKLNHMNFPDVGFISIIPFDNKNFAFTQKTYLEP